MKTNKHIAIIGAGVAGSECAIQLAEMGYKISMIEKSRKPGGKLNEWAHLFPDNKKPEELLQKQSEKLKDENINIIYNTEICSIRALGKTFDLSDDKNISITADAVVLANGFNLFDAKYKEEYGYGIFDNVITSADFEKISASGRPFLTSTGEIPSRIAIIHCVGSRDAKSGNTYCSKVCCITALKQAIEINNLYPECEVYCFYMDLRLYGSNFDQIYLNAQRHHNIQFIRGRLSELSEKQDKSLQLKAEDTLSGRPLRMNANMVILMVGMEPCESHKTLCKSNDLQLDENGFFKSADLHLKRNLTDQKGIFAAGTCLCPMSVSDSLENARSAALAVHQYLKQQS